MKNYLTTPTFNISKQTNNKLFLIRCYFNLLNNLKNTAEYN